MSSVCWFDAIACMYVCVRRIFPLVDSRNVQNATFCATIAIQMSRTWNIGSVYFEEERLKLFLLCFEVSGKCRNFDATQTLQGVQRCMHVNWIMSKWRDKINCTLLMHYYKYCVEATNGWSLSTHFILYLSFHIHFYCTIRNASVKCRKTDWLWQWWKMRWIFIIV